MKPASILEMPHIDIKDFHWSMGAKFVIALFIFKSLSWWLALPLFVLLSVVYRHIVAKVTGLKVMAVGDFNTFVTNSKAPTNIMTCTPCHNTKPEYAREAFSRMVKAHVKARSSIVKICGDYYYKEHDEQEVIA